MIFGGAAAVGGVLSESVTLQSRSPPGFQLSYKSVPHSESAAGSGTQAGRSPTDGRREVGRHGPARLDPGDQQREGRLDVRRARVVVPLRRGALGGEVGAVEGGDEAGPRGEGSSRSTQNRLSGFEVPKDAVNQTEPFRSVTTTETGNPV
jgi:hypothetical protein